MTIGTRIQQLRLSFGLSQEEFGEKLGVSRQTVSKWELDQAFPELAKIVQISRLFSVTTDSLLIDGITSFDLPCENVIGGIYRGEFCEIVETGKYSLIYECSADKTLLTASLYSGYKNKKTLTAVCQRDTVTQTTSYAFRTKSGYAVTNDAVLSARLGEAYDPDRTSGLKRLKRLETLPLSEPLPTVSEVGLRKALSAWRCGADLIVDNSRFLFAMFIGEQEYILHITIRDADIYCSASYNVAFDMGLFSAGQYFRIRHFQDNRAPFCSFHADFSYVPSSLEPPTSSFQDSCNTVWTVKRYSDDEIVLNGCGGDEYVYRRDRPYTERYRLV